MDKIVNWLLLIIIFVFDPLAISLVVAANFAFAQLRSKNEYPIEEKVVNTHDTLEDELKNYDVTLNDSLEDKSYNLEEILNKSDLNNDGYITEDEAKLANLSPEVVFKLNELNQSIKKLKDTNQKQKYDFNWNELDAVQDELKNVKKLSFELGMMQSKSKKKDDDTITYF
jgi:outer membrane protein assembly factor BamA